MRTCALAILLAACGTPDAPVATQAVYGLSVDAVVDTVGSQRVVRVQVSAPADATWQMTEPTAKDLVLGAPEERVERLGDRIVTTRTYGLQGPPGSYVVDPICAQEPGSDDPPACAPPIYVDLGAQPDRTGMADIVEPAATWPLPSWPTLAGLVLGLLAMVGGASWWWRKRPEPELAPVPEEPAHVLAIRKWEALRANPNVSDFDKALGLSEIFRTYTAATLDFPADAWSTSQILAHLEGMNSLPKLNVPRARRLLRATDRVKYAEARPGEHFFDDLEADLHAFIDQTRPRSFTPTEAP